MHWDLIYFLGKLFWCCCHSDAVVARMRPSWKNYHCIQPSKKGVNFIQTWKMRNRRACLVDIPPRLEAMHFLLFIANNPDDKPFPRNLDFFTTYFLQYKCKSIKCHLSPFYDFCSSTPPPPLLDDVLVLLKYYGIADWSGLSRKRCSRQGSGRSCTLYLSRVTIITNTI